jgi:hypothetical protein
MNIIRRSLDTEDEVAHAGFRMSVIAAAVSLLMLFGAVPVFAAGPTITSLSTTSTFVGYAVTITGTNFGSSKGSSTVTFNGTTATSVNWGSSGTSIVAHVPAAATSGNVVVTVGGVQSNPVALTVVPVIDVPSPNSGPAGGPPLRFL